MITIDLLAGSAGPVALVTLGMFLVKKVEFDKDFFHAVIITSIKLLLLPLIFFIIDKNMVVQGAYFDHKGETPGLGANIKERYFMDDFKGEHLLDDDGNFEGITVAKGNADPKNENKTDNEVDAIAGATITGDGVTAMIKSDLRLYVPYFKNLKNE